MTDEQSNGSDRSDGGKHYVLNGKPFPMRHEPRCATCRHPRRVDIDSWLVAGSPPSAIVDRLGRSSPSTSSLGRHREAHLPIDLVARDALLLERAADGHPLDAQVQHLLDTRQVARLLGEKAVEAVLAGDIVPASLTEVIKVIDLQLRLDQMATVDEDEVARTQFMTIRMLRHVRDNVSPEDWTALGEAVKDDPILNAIEQLEAGRETEYTKAVLVRELAHLDRP